MQASKYKFLTKRECRPYRRNMYNWAIKNDGILKSLKDEFRISATLMIVGSARRKLVIERPGNEPYDFDYQIRISSDGSNLNLKELKQTVFDYFQELLSEQGYKIENSTSAVTIKKITNNHVDYSYDVTILSKNRDDLWQILKYDKVHNNYTWNILKNSKNFYTKYNKKIVGKKVAVFREEYLDMKKKNWSLPVDEQLTSSEILVNATNKIIDNS